MTKYRTNPRHDAPTPRKPKPETAGKLPPGRIGVYDGKGRLRGHVGHLATQVTASRFTKEPMKLGKVGNTLAWVSAQGSATPGATGDTLADISSRGATTTKIQPGRN